MPPGKPQSGRIRQADRLRSSRLRYIIQKTRRRRRDDAENSHLRRRRRRPRADRGGPPRLRGRASGARHRDDRLFLRLCDAGRLREGRLSGYRPAGHLYARNAGDGAGAGHSPVQRKYGHSFPDDQLGLRGGRLRAPRRGLHSKAVHAGKTQRLAGSCDRPAAGADMAPAPLRGRAAPHRAGGRAVHRDRRQAAHLLSGLRPEADGAADRRPAAGLPGGTARHDPMRSLLRCEPCTRPLLFRHGPYHGRRRAHSRSAAAARPN